MTGENGFKLRASLDRILERNSYCEGGDTLEQNAQRCVGFPILKVFKASVDEVLSNLIKSRGLEG